MRTSSLANAAIASIAAIAIAAPLAAQQGTPPAPPAPAAPAAPPAGVPSAPRAPLPPAPPRAPVPGERVRVLERRLADDSAFRNRPTLGMTLSATGSVRDTIGVFVARVVPGGPAERAGIVEGDRIAAIDGVSLKVNPADVGDPYAAGLPAHRVSRTVGKLTPGKTVTLRVYADGHYRDVTVATGRAGDVYKDHPFMIFSMNDLDQAMLPAMAAIGAVGPELERIGPMLERMGPMIHDSVEGALLAIPRHMDVKVDLDDVAPTPPPPPPARHDTH
jgi:hypothetical protein